MELGTFPIDGAGYISYRRSWVQLEVGTFPIEGAGYFSYKNPFSILLYIKNNNVYLGRLGLYGRG